LDESGLFGEREAGNFRDHRPLAMKQPICRGAAGQENTRNRSKRDQFGTHDNFLPAKK
jgi:hypothetical protein